MATKASSADTQLQSRRMSLVDVAGRASKTSKTQLPPINFTQPSVQPFTPNGNVLDPFSASNKNMGSEPELSKFF